ncbi:MAG: TRAP transporter large permease [Hydrogenophaga sp.]|jgi:tripartite ATP-independent transporter DctM subunit|uniref:TRAP transporter large permease n=1 Tax=Hydrogenophaga sp. TaxID=1904254 RepID=UPI00271F5A50|nr:TRAP transporter large permease [Hydrogenophaga sp.]MDO9479059.1 TRAP transporter large permease [Hydrogenophaga sp.]MDP1893500.1 TRAP transporter large permease [Hydrogenophaga sp.]MDP2095645.1 TRAP transporter large permease [Hydrogenophaga sp.]MDP3344513.1 TRAP transporter large permease [Hydrogenophaga sp.]MDP3805383.1 TRAP transporter large permease [Hydrogenophaga sp.]
MITLIVFFGLLFAGLPIVGAILAGALAFMATNDLAVLYDSVPIQFYGALEINSLLAIPLFLLVGEIMNKAGLTQRLIAVAEVLVGNLKGGLAYANLFTNAMAASILGSAVAQIGVMSKVMIPAMERMGYNRAFSGAVTVTSGLLGPIIPPSMLMIIYGVVAVQPIAPLFIAGIVPGLLIVAALALVIFLHGVFGPGLPAGAKSERANSIKVLLEGLVPAVIPVVVIAGIMLGVMTPTESGAVAAIIALALGFVYREIQVRDLGPILLGVATNTATITGLIAAASVLSWVLAFQGVPDLVVETMQDLTQSPFVFLLLVMLMLMVLGMFLESISVLIVVVPLLMPVVNTLGIDPIHFGVVCTVATVIGLVTPPVGPGLYIAMVQANIRMGPLFKATVPFLLAVLLTLVLIAAVPELSTWLPALTAG